MHDIQKMFDTFSEGNIFKDRQILYDSWLPNIDLVVHRKKELEAIGFIFAPLIKKSSPNNCIIYGPSGSGKTLLVKLVQNEVELFGKTNKINGFQIAYIKCSEANTEFNILLRISELLNLGYKGTRKNIHYNLLANALKNKRVVLILDEFDKLKECNDIIFNFSRMKNLSIVGIANDMGFTNNFEGRTKSSFKERQILINGYNAIQLRDILNKRVGLAFSKGVVNDGIVGKCAALSAQENGDARGALDLLRTAGEVAEKKGRKKILNEDVDEAEKIIDSEIILKYVDKAPPQIKMILASIILLEESGIETIQTGDVYDQYMTIAMEKSARTLTQRRVTDLISNLDTVGVINTRILYKGAYGRTRQIRLLLSKGIKNKIRDVLERGTYIPKRGEFLGGE